MLGEGVALDLQLLVAHEGEDGVNHLRSDVGLVLKTEAPDVDQRRHGDVESAVGLLCNLLREVEHFGEHRVLGKRPVVVEAGKGAAFIEHRHTLVDASELGFDVGTQVLRAGVFNMIAGAEDASLVGVVLRGGEDEDGSRDEGDEKAEGENAFHKRGGGTNVYAVESGRR